MRQAVLFTMVVVAAVLVCVLSPAPASATKTTVFISDTIGPSHLETHTVDITNGGSGELGIWVIPDFSQTLNLIDLNLRIDEPGGDAINFSGATVWNPLIDGAGGAKRWFDNNATTGVDDVSLDLVTGMIGEMTGIGGSGAGTGLSDANGENDPLYDAGTGAYLFATVYYNVVNSSEAADLYLQISDDGIVDTGGSVAKVFFGLVDPFLNAGEEFDLNVDSATEDAVTDSVPVEPPVDLLLGDMTGDGFVNSDDVPAFFLALLDRPAYHAAFPLVNEVSAGDINGDWTLDLGDIGPFSNLISGLASASASAAPEPSTIMLTAIGLLALVGYGRRR